MGKPMNYAGVAATYANQRWALHWKLQPLLDAVDHVSSPSVIVDIGCGTGDYLLALYQRHPKHRYWGLDISPEMLKQARSRCPWATLEVANADNHLPGDAGSVDLVYSLDVLHHLKDYRRFFTECARLLRAGRTLIAITDSEKDIHGRTLAEFFPETVPINLNRYPRIAELEAFAVEAGLQLVSRQTARGYIDLDDRFIQTLAEKALSELRLIPDEFHEVGMERARAARGGRWLSQSTVMVWVHTNDA